MVAQAFGLLSCTRPVMVWSADASAGLGQPEPGKIGCSNWLFEIIWGL
jgi:hypothetical protein